MLPVWLIPVLPSFEAGFWSAILMRRRRDPRHVRDVLIRGGAAGRLLHLPMIDERLRQQVRGATKAQRIAGNWLARTIRRCVNSVAFEHLTLMAVKARWPKFNKPISKEVTLCL